jgi:hypothetical protein
MEVTERLPWRMPFLGNHPNEAHRLRMKWFWLNRKAWLGEDSGEHSGALLFFYKKLTFGIESTICCGIVFICIQQLVC